MLDVGSERVNTFQHIYTYVCIVFFSGYKNYLLKELTIKN